MQGLKRKAVWEEIQEVAANFCLCSLQERGRWKATEVSRLLLGGGAARRLDLEIWKYISVPEGLICRRVLQK